MRRKLFLTFLVGIMTTIALVACGGLPTSGPQTDDTSALYTQAAETVIARLTLQAGESAIAKLTELAAGNGGAIPTATSMAVDTSSPVPATSTALPTATPQPTATLPPTATALPTATPIPPTPTPTPLPCDWASFVGDVLISDGNTIKAGTTFTKTWRLQNACSCTWTSAYTLVVDGENIFNAPLTSPITAGSVAPGANIDVSVTLAAPSLAGRLLSGFPRGGRYRPAAYRFARRRSR